MGQSARHQPDQLRFRRRSRPQHPADYRPERFRRPVHDRRWRGPPRLLSREEVPSMKTLNCLLAAALVTVSGCGEVQKVASVSGVVTLNGKRLANASVTFSPIAKEGSIDAGDGSAGKTNANGEYTLTTSRGVPGAMVGKHRVR